MELKPKQDLLRLAVIQFCILNIAWGFYASVRVMNPLPLPDATAVWVYNNPTETTLVVTMVATVVSSITLNCFTQAAKHALKQYIGTRKTISLANLSIGVALASATFTFKRKPRYLGPTFGTLVIAIAFGLVNSAWTTYLTPVQVNMFVAMRGEELDLGSPAFDAVLGLDMNNTFGFANGTLVTPPISANSLASVAYTGGLMSAGAYASGQPGILNFNNVTFGVSTGGVLSAVKGYTSQSNFSTPASDGMPASFGGGSVPTNLAASEGFVGISRTYNISQQGLTANVSCYNYTNPADWYPIQVQEVSVNATYEMDGFVSGIFPVSNTTLPRLNCNPNVSGEGMIASMAAVNFNNSNYMASVVCPYTWNDARTADKIVVYHSGVGKYAALPPTICEIELLLTETSVLYADLVTPVVRASRPIPGQHNVNFWVTLFIELEEWGFQTARVNSLGNMLFSLLASGSPVFSETPVQSYQLFLQAFWRGLIEVTGTALRSGYTAYPQNVTTMRIPMNGTQNITTMGWALDNKTRKYALVPITVTAAMTFAVILFALHHVRRAEQAGEGGVEEGAAEGAGAGAGRGEGRGETASMASVGGGMGSGMAGMGHQDHLGRLVVPHSAIGTFDASDPTHLLVASAARHPGDRRVRDRRYWEQWDENVVIFQMQPEGPPR